MRVDEPVSQQACAKINLTFEVLGKRRDGYHEIMSVVQAISFCDTLTFEHSDHISLSCNVPQLVTPHNLALEAAGLMRRHTGRRRGADIDIVKAIPLASGLGGGSSDAAAVLLGLNRLWEAGLPRQDLLALAADIGSDVPFFAGGHHTALVRGRGELIEPLPSPLPMWVVLLCPPLEIQAKTARMYAHLEPSMYTAGQYSERLANALTACRGPADSICYNVFEGVSLSFFCGLEEYRQRFLDAGAPQVNLTGAGPTFFALMASEVEAVRVFGALKKEDLPAYLARTL